MILPTNFTATRKVTPLSSEKIYNVLSDAYSRSFQHYESDTRIEILGTLRNKLVSYFAPSIDLSTFKHFYLTSGITDGLNYYSNQNSDSVIDMLPGEYEYLNLFRKKIESTNKVLYVTNPSAITGDYIEDDTFEHLCNTHKRVILDCAYLGTAENKKIKRHESIDTVVLGLSKTFGLPDSRIGYIFTNKKIPLLNGIIYDNAYFNMQACFASIDLMSTFELGHLHSIYKDQQIKVCNDYDLTPSDVFLFGTSVDNQYDYFSRGAINRICLTEKMNII